MSRILVAVVPFAGHVSPTTGVVAEMLARGHEVVVYTGSRYLARFEALGARVTSWTAAPDFDENNLAATFPEVGRRGPLGLLANVEHVFIRTAPGQVADIVAEYQRHAFDLVVGDIMSLGASLAAEKIGLPWATLSVVPLSLPSVDLPPTGMGLLPGAGGVGAVRDGLLRGIAGLASAPLERAFRDVRRQLGLGKAARPFSSALYSPWLVAVTGSPSIEYRRSDLEPQFHFVGRLAPAGPLTSSLPSWWAEVASSDRRVVLVTQGTFNIDPTDLVIPSLAALSDTGAIVLATTAGAELPEPVPHNARLAPFLPFAEVLPRVDVVITNGGWGGVLETLSHGIPLIVAGGDLDKPDIAARIAWSGAGIDLRSGHPRAASVARAWETIEADPSYAARAAVVATELAALGGSATAVTLVEELLATGRPVLRDREPWG